MYSNGFTGCTEGDIRLTGGGSKHEGTVEICHNQTWGMVSGLGWGEEDARVTCRQLQLPVEGLCNITVYLGHLHVHMIITTLIRFSLLF